MNHKSLMFEYFSQKRSIYSYKSDMLRSQLIVGVYSFFLLALASFPVTVSGQSSEGIVVEATVTTVPAHPVPSTEDAKNLWNSIRPALSLIWPTTFGSGSVYGIPDPVETRYTVSILGNRMRLDWGGSSILAAVTDDGTVAEIRVIDPTSNRVIDSDLFNASVNPSSGESAIEFSDDQDIGPGENTFTFTPTGITSQILGHTASQYKFNHRVYFNVGLQQLPANFKYLLYESQGIAWVGETGPYVGEPGVSGFLNLMATSLANQGFGSATTQQIVDSGLVLGISDTTRVLAMILSEVEGSGLADVQVDTLLQSFSKTEITSFSPQSLDDELFSGFERQEQQCNCSCAAMEEAKALGDLPKAQQEAYPGAMNIAMCIPKCSQRWIQNCDTN